MSSIDGRRGRRTALATLTAAQALGLSGAPLVVMVGGIVGAELAPAVGLASLPLATMVVGTALGSAPAALAMRRFGRRLGFTVGAVVGTGGALLACVAVVRDSFAALTLATLVMGANLAFVMQYRFAAAEAAGSGGRERAVAVVLSGGVVAGLLGPELGAAGRLLLSTPWAGSFLALAGVYAILALVLIAGLERGRASSGPERAVPPAGLERSVRPAGATEPDPIAGAGRGTPTRPDFALAVAAGVTAYAVMTLLMTATPLAMRVAGFDANAIALVIQGHVVAMYAPSIAAGALVSRFGSRRLMAGGLVAMGACVALGLSAGGLGAWIAQLALLGLGWNALFLGATVTLADAVGWEARFRAQALNESLVFGAQAVASLAAGTFVSLGGWATVNVVAMGPLVLMTLVLVRSLTPRAAVREPA